jgi:hypothetical protein
MAQQIEISKGDRQIRGQKELICRILEHEKESLAMLVIPCRITELRVEAIVRISYRQL